MPQIWYAVGRPQTGVKRNGRVLQSNWSTTKLPLYAIALADRSIMEPMSLHVFRDNAAGEILVALAPADEKSACRWVGLAISGFLLPCSQSPCL
jgi:hypothetical protein